MPSSLWCQNDPIVKLTFIPPYPHPGPTQHALIRIVTRATFRSPHTTRHTDDMVYLELLTPISVKSKVVQDKTDPLLPQDFQIDDEVNLEVIHTPSTNVGNAMLKDTFAAACELFIELSDSLDPAHNDDIDEIRVIVYNRTKAILAEHVFLPTTSIGAHTMRFQAAFDNDGKDHTDDVVL